MISVLAGRNLPKRDTHDNLSDPYVQIFFDKVDGKEVFRTKTAENQLNPEWKEHNIYRNKDSGLFGKHETIIFRVMDCDDSFVGSLNPDDFIGTYEMDINFEEPIIDQWVDLKDTKNKTDVTHNDKSGGYKSQIRISVRYPSYKTKVEEKENHGEESTMQQNVKYTCSDIVREFFYIAYVTIIGGTG